MKPNKQTSPYRSKGERRIADFLSRNQIPFNYEPPTFIYDMNCKLRLWYPDFQIKGREGFILEYAGIQNNPDYDKGIAKKKRLYKDNGLDALFLYPRDIYQENWQDNLEDKIRRYQASKAAQSPGGSHQSGPVPYQSDLLPQAGSLRAPTYQNRYF